MSAFLMDTETVKIIAGYLTESLNCGMGVIAGIKTIEPPASMHKALEERGCLDDNGDFNVSKVYEELMKDNVEALRQRYDENNPIIPYGEFVPVNTKEENRREWLVNLYMITRCYHYQTDEGTVTKGALFNAVGEWIAKMAKELADYVVAEVRPAFGKPGYKPWSAF